MAKKKNKLFFEENESITHILEDLLDLSLLKFDDNENKINTFKVPEINQNKAVTLNTTRAVTNLNKNVFKKEPMVPTPEVIDLHSIIEKARQKNNKFIKETGISNFIEPEQVILEKAKKQGKSAYDSDILRELILERQKKKRELMGLSSIINKAKTRK
ncbi:hypothetical protein [Spiroplasma cantharicola]|uniref:Uncharacterized protein n=1 Tax=Spiroplasma cantharicola TaxID=362837 RepID=A0A0M3SJ83_9MOLU|nr:hypothetical protein [Spiroplasma cantharicola]ALD66284.1 hypothetical protein SCANT_v1c03740 [Spiroplasma cantharicola]